MIIITTIIIKSTIRDSNYFGKIISLLKIVPKTACYIFRELGISPNQTMIAQIDHLHLKFIVYLTIIIMGFIHDFSK